MEQFLSGARACFDVCFASGTHSVTLCSGPLSLCGGSAFGASCPSLLALLSHYLSSMEVHGFLKGATAEKLKTQ